MMKKSLGFFSLMLLVSSLSAEVSVLPEEASYPRLSVPLPWSINVKSFGARGDGIHDDTEAIQKAADAAAARVAPSRRDWMCTRYYRCMHDAPVPEIVFPAGVYRLTRAVVFNWSTSLRGIGDVTIRNSSSTQDSFYFEYALRIHIENLKFDGGAHQIRHWTNNLDTATVKIAGCTFRNAAEAAIHAASYRLRTGKKYKSRYEEQKAGIPKLTTSPYQVIRRNGRVELKPRPEETIEEYENSTNFLVADSLFENNACAMNLRSDGVIIRDCRIITPHDMKGAAIVVGCKAHLFHLQFEIRRNQKWKQYAIRQLSGNVTLSDSVIRSDGDVSVFLVEANASTSMIASATSLRNVQTSCGREPVLVFAPGRFPNLVTAWGVRERVPGKPGFTPFFSFRKIPTRQELDSQLKGKRHPYLGVKRSYAVSLGRMGKEFDLTLPEALADRRINIPDPVFKMEKWPAPPQKFRGPLFVDPDLGGEKEQIARDDTAKLQALFDKAAESGGGIVALPPRWIRVNRRVIVPGNTLVYGAGRTIIDARNDAEPVFTIPPGADRVEFVNLTIRRGLHAVETGNSSGSVRLDNCCLYDQKQESLLFTAPTKQNNLSLVLSGGVAYTPFLYRGNASAFLDGIWFSCNPDYPPEEYRYSFVAITNLTGGRLTITDMLGVPCYFRHIPMHLIWRPEPEKNGDFRWIDNYGSLYLLNNRFGGEWGGLTPVYQYGDADTYMEGPFVSLNCPRIRRSPVVSKGDRNRVLLVNLITMLYNEPLLLHDGKGVQKDQPIFCCYPVPDRSE